MPKLSDSLQNYYGKCSKIFSVSDKFEAFSTKRVEMKFLNVWHYEKSVQMWSYFWGKILRISPYSVRMRENTDQK